MSREKIGNILETIFGWGIFVCLIAGGLAFFGFLAGIIMGGGADSAAQSLSEFIQKQYFPAIIRISAIVVGIGLVSMYFKKEEALSLKAEKKEADAELNAIKEDAKKET